MANSTRRRRPRHHQDAKPSKDFPLTAHPSGKWCKKIKGKLHYFGTLDKPQAALDKWLREKDYLLAGRRPPQPGEPASPTLESLVNRFLTSKKTIKRSAWTLASYEAMCTRVMDEFRWDRPLTDIGPDDFTSLYGKWSETWGATRMAAEVNRTKALFNFAYKTGMVDRPIRFGETFVRPSKKDMRLAKHARGPMLFTDEELRTIIAAAGQPLKAMFLLAVNGGLGNNDIAQLPLTALDLHGKRLIYPRVKTGILRVIPLWDETVAAIENWLAIRPKPHSAAEENLLFVTRTGKNWQPNPRNREITAETRKLLDSLGINGGRNFYVCRHVFETIGGESRDQVAVDAIMGHDDGSMANNYRERISDERLKTVTEYVRNWLYPERPPESEAGQK